MGRERQVVGPAPLQVARPQLQKRRRGGHDAGRVVGKRELRLNRRSVGPSRDRHHPGGGPGELRCGSPSPDVGTVGSGRVDVQRHRSAIFGAAVRGAVHHEVGACVQPVANAYGIWMAKIDGDRPLVAGKGTPPYVPDALRSDGPEWRSRRGALAYDRVGAVIREHGGRERTCHSRVEFEHAELGKICLFVRFGGHGFIRHATCRGRYRSIQYHTNSNIFRIDLMDQLIDRSCRARRRSRSAKA